jgi:hypothetical protein
MSTTHRREDRSQHDHEPAVALSAEERAVLARIHKQTRSNLRTRLARFAKNPPLFWFFGWGGCW